MNAYRKPADDIPGTLERHEARLDALEKRLAKPAKPKQNGDHWLSPAATFWSVYGANIFAAWLCGVGTCHFATEPWSFWGRVWAVTLSLLAVVGSVLAIVLLTESGDFIEKIRASRAEEVE